MNWQLASAAVLVVSLPGLLGCEDVEDARTEPSTPARRASEFRSERVERALDDASEVVRTRGFAADGDERRAFLVRHDTDVSELSMRTGTCYVIVASGSSALRDLDLRIFDSEGAEVAQDGRVGGSAAVQYCPSQAGSYYVAVRAASGSGLFAMRRFVGPTGLEIRLDDLFGSSPVAVEVP